MVMATSARTHFVAGSKNELVSQKRPSRSVTVTRDEGGRLAKLWAFVKPRAAVRDAEDAQPAKGQSASSVQSMPRCWTDVINDPVLWKELREVVLDDADDYIA